MERALETLELYAHFCRATGVEDVRPVATSAIRDAANQGAFLHAARERTGLEVRVLSREEEARYGYLAAVNSTTLADGVALDLGGGSMQLMRVEAGWHRRRSWPLGAVRMTERFLPRRAREGQAGQGAARARRRAARRGEVARARRAAGGRRRHGPQPRLGGGDRGRAAVLRRAGLLDHARGARRARRAAGRAARLRARLGARDQGGARRPDPRRRAGRAVRDGGGRLRGAGGHGGRPARGRLLRDAARRPRPAADRGRAARVGAQPRQRLRRGLRARRARRPARAGALGGARPPACTTATPGRARPAVVGGDAARHRHGRRLRRPPQALALPDPQRRAAGLLPARDRPDRPARALPPQGLARPRRVLRARARRRRGDGRALRGRPAARRAARAPARPDRRGLAVEVERTAGRPAAAPHARTSPSPAGRPSASATCSRRRSGGSSRSWTSASRPRGRLAAKA